MTLEQYAEQMEHSVSMLWSQIHDAGVTPRQLYELLTDPKTKETALMVMQLADADSRRPLRALRASGAEGTCSPSLLITALELTRYGFPVAVTENQLIVYGDPITLAAA